MYWGPFAATSRMAYFGPSGAKTAFGPCHFGTTLSVVSAQLVRFSKPTFQKSRRATLDGPNRQSPIASVQRTRSTLAGHPAGPRGTNTTPTNANRAIRITAQRMQGLRGPNSVFRGDMTANERQ